MIGRWITIDWEGFGHTEPPENVFQYAARQMRRFLAAWQRPVPKDIEQ